jgi:uncharacterized membrane protein
VDWLVFAVQWLHVLTAVTWFGAIIYADFILIPALTTLPIDQQRAAGGAVGARAQKVILPAAIAVIVLGVLRGTVFGSIKTADTLFGTAYGITWLVALVLALVTAYWGARVVGGAVDKISAFDPARTVLADGQPNPEFTALVDDVKRKGLIELVLFLAIFTCMILMRFGQ